jgi:two-component system sensor histidine kinase BaeS
VIVAAHRAKGRIELSVSDNGPGIPPEDIPHIFERFWRAEKSRNRATGGSGLGLAIVKQLIEAHHGEVQVESQTGSGTRFTIRLPVA